MTQSYLGLGSNLRSPVRQLRQAIKQLRQLPRSVIKKKSRIYVSRPLGVRAQPHFCNMVILLNTRLSPLKLLRHCQFIEHKQHRVRKKHWGARTIDIDLLLYGKRRIKSQSLIVPHNEMLHRDFVIVPLLEISPEISLPSGEKLSRYRFKTAINYLQ